MAIPRITVCICTFKRPAMLDHLLRTLETQRTDGLFDFDVADNDAARSAEPVVGSFAAASSLTVTYAAEPIANIALARNTAVAHAQGDFIAFIDDDEFPSAGWLLSLFRTREARSADGV